MTVRRKGGELARSREDDAWELSPRELRDLAARLWDPEDAVFDDFDDGEDITVPPAGSPSAL